MIGKWRKSSEETTKIQRKRNRSQEVGLLLASAVIPKTFQRSLMPRSDLDQGLMTGIIIAMVYMMGTIFQDVAELGVGEFIDEQNAKQSETDGVKLNSSAVIGVIALGVGYWLENKYKYDPEEKLIKSGTRTGGMWLKRIGLAGVTIGTIEAINNAVSKDEESASQRNLIPYIIGAGLMLSLADELMKSDGNKLEIAKSNLTNAKPIKIVGIGAGVAALLASLAYGERVAARVIDRTIEDYAPSIKKSWLPLGHMISAGLMVFGIAKFMQNTYKKIENNAENLEEGYLDPPKTELSSGGKKSAVKWHTLTIQGRRHIGSKLSADEITAVMGEKAVEPIRIFVGLDSAPTEEDRVLMALEELERTGAYEREVILAVSPTGTGYINYITSESFEYMTRGNMASVAIQYSKRPSPMSLDRVDEGFRQYRMLLNGIKRRIDTLPANKRPRLVLFGESLGAWTSQNAFVNEGTDGLQYLGVDSALWIGSPAGSKWKDQVLSGKMLNVERELIGSFDNYDEVKELSTAEKRKIRYVLLTHYNDPINQFGLDLLIKQPAWIDDPNKRPKDMKGKMYFRSPTLFIQMLFGMKNALKPIPGDFVASGHDYRADLARFIKFTYRFNVSATQLAEIEKQLRLNELERARNIELGIAEQTN